MSSEMVAIITSSMTTPGALALQQSFEHAGYAASLILLGDGREAASRIDRADTVIFRIGPKTFMTYRDIVLPRLNNKQHKRLLSRMLDAFDKGVQAQTLRHGRVPIPATRVIHYVSELAPWLPCVLKQPTGNRGSGVFLAQDRDTTTRVAGQLIDTAGYCIQQEYVHVRTASDKRLFVVGGEVVAAMRRTAKDDDFRSNLHRGGSGDPYIPLTDERNIAVLAAACLELPFCGVDIIDGPAGPLVLEVNPSPGFAIAEITEIPVPDIVANYYIEKMPV